VAGVSRLRLGRAVGLPVTWGLFVLVAFEVPSQAAVDLVEVHVVVVEMNDADEASPAVFLVPLDDHRAAGKLSAQLEGAGFAPGLAFLRRVYARQAHLLAMARGLHDEGATVTGRSRPRWRPSPSA
jgi:hypothetical protein